MADNITLSAGSGGDTVIADDVSSVKIPGGKIVVGADGVNDGYVSDSNPLPIDDAGGSLTVDGTVAATQSGTWNITNVSGTVSLPTGAATAAKQPALGTAGAASSDVITIQGIASMTPLQVADNGSSLTVDGTVAATQSGTWNVGTVTTLTSITNAVTIQDGGNTITVDGTVAISGTVTVGSHAVTNAGTFAVQVDGSALTALQKIDDPVLVDDAAFTPATSSVMMAGFEADESSTDSVDEGDAGAARMTLDRKQIVNAQPHTSGGLTMSKTVSAASTNATVVKASAGNLYEIFCSNVNAAVRYLKLYDKATSPTVGTDTPVWTLAIPGNTAGAGFAKSIPLGLTFTAGISFALTTEATDAGTTAVAANELVVNLGYK